MDTDLFSLRGVVIEKEPPTVDIFSLRGVVIESVPPGVDVSRSRLLVGQKSDNSLTVPRVRLLVAQSSVGGVFVQPNVETLQLIRNMIQKLAKSTIDWSKYTLSLPSAVSGNADPKIAQLTITANPGSGYRGTQALTFYRRYLEDLGGLNLVPGSSLTTVRQVVDLTRSRTYLIADADIDFAASTVTSTQIQLVAHATSYLFIPGSIVTWASA